MSEKHSAQTKLSPWQVRNPGSPDDERAAAKRAATRLNEMQRQLQLLGKNATVHDLAALLVKVFQFDEAVVGAPDHESSSSGAGNLVHPSATAIEYNPSTDSFVESVSADNIVDPFGLVFDQDETTIAFPHNGHWLPLFARTVRTARTCVDFDGTYPPSSENPNVYPIQFVKVEYEEEAGLQERDVTNLRNGGTPDAYVCNIAGDDLLESSSSGNVSEHSSSSSENSSSGSGSSGGDTTTYISVGTLIQVYNVTDQWFTRVVAGSGGAKFIEFIVTAAGPPYQNDETYCNSVAADVTLVSCDACGVSVGDEINIWDPRGCWFNIPVDNLDGAFGTAVWMKKPDGMAESDCENDDPSETCYWVCTELCCREEVYDT